MTSSATGSAGASRLDPTRLCSDGEVGLAKLKPPHSGGCIGFFALLCPFVLCLFLGKMGFFFKLGNPRKWKKRREAESRVRLSFLFSFWMGRAGLNLG